jgi:hypothetical protein
MHTLPCFLFIILLLQINEIAGQITNASAQPLSDVNVCTASWNCNKSDQDGLYRIQNLHNIIRFSGSGLKPVIIPVDQSRMNIVMEKANASDTERVIPTCSVPIDKIGPPLIKTQGRYIGNELKIFVPEGMTIKESIETDYSMAVVSYGSGREKEIMVVGNGPTWSMSGLPDWIRKGPTHIADRDVICKNHPKDQPNSLCSNVVDVRGYSEDKRYWRFIGDSFETIEYKAVSQKAAENYDKILDTLCSN